MPLLGWWHQVNSVAAGVLALLFQVGEHALVRGIADFPSGSSGVSGGREGLSRFQVKLYLLTLSNLTTEPLRIGSSKGFCHNQGRP